MKIGLSLLACAIALKSFAGPLEDNARRLLAEYGESVVSFRAVVRVEAPGMTRGPQEREITGWGTVVASNGLTVVSATSLSPLSGLTEAFEMTGVRPTTSVSQIRIRQKDGNEIPARQVLTDDELDVTFLLPENREDRSISWPKPVVFTAGVRAQVFDTLIGLAGTGEMFGWLPAVGSAQVNGVVERPRRMYLITRPFSNAVGTPLFLPDGRPLGLAVVRRETMPGRTSRGPQVQQAVVVLPAEDLAEMMTRAMKAAEAGN